MSTPSKCGIRYAGIFRERRVRKSGVRPKGPPFEFKEVLPVSLNNSVSGKHDKETKVACLQEMSVMFACFKKNDFNQAKCAVEIEAFSKCALDFKESKRLKQTEDRSGVLVPGRTELNSRQLNMLLRKFPHNVKPS